MQYGITDARREPYHALPGAEVLSRFEVSVSYGLLRLVEANTIVVHRKDDAAFSSVTNPIIVLSANTTAIALPSSHSRK